MNTMTKPTCKVHYLAYTSILQFVISGNCGKYSEQKPRTAGTEEEAKEKAAYWLAAYHLLSLISWQPVHKELDPLTSTINQENAIQSYQQDNITETFPAEILFFPDNTSLCQVHI